LTDVGREAEPQAERLQELLQRLESGETPRAVRGALAGDPAAAEPVELAALALAMGRVLPVAAPPALKARLQTELQAELLASHAPRRRSVAARWVPRFTAAGLALAMVLASAVAGSADSLPGHVLYPVKRAVEDTRLALAPDGEARARLRLQMAGSRALELRLLAEAGAPIAADWIDDLIRAQSAAETAVGAVGSAELLAALAATSDAALEALSLAARNVRAAERQPLLETVAAVAGRGATATPTGTSTAPPAPQPRQQAAATDGPGSEDDRVPASGPPAELVATATSAPPLEVTATPQVPSGPGDGAPRRDRSTSEPIRPPATPTAPEPPLPADTPQPTLDRGAQREATVRAPSPTPTPRLRPPWPGGGGGGGEPSPQPPMPTEDRA